MNRAHVRRRDTLIMTLTAALAGVLSLLANMAMWRTLFGRRNAANRDGRHSLAGIPGMIVAPFAAILIQLVISRSREFLADELGAKLARKPLLLARALRKIEDWSQTMPLMAGSPATAHLFIINPFASSGLSSLFRTHPSTEDRIARLQTMATHRGQDVPTEATRFAESPNSPVSSPYR
jgi:heat shock protein HtpX